MTLTTNDKPDLPNYFDVTDRTTEFAHNTELLLIRAIAPTKALAVLASDVHYQGHTALDTTYDNGCSLVSILVQYSLLRISRLTRKSYLVMSTNLWLEIELNGMCLPSSIKSIEEV